MISKRSSPPKLRKLLLLIGMGALTASCRHHQDAVTQPEPASIALSSTFVTFTTTRGAPNPTAQVVSISNGGGGSLTGLVTTISYTGAAPQRWLSVAINSATAPAQLTLAVASGSLAPGNYLATLEVTSQGALNSPQTISVALYVAESLPAAPSSLVLTPIASDEIDLSWTKTGSTESGFHIERCTNQRCTSLVDIGSTGANITTYHNTGLAPQTTYGYRVRAYNAAGNSPYSNVVYAATLPLMVGVPAPSTLMATAVSASQINLSWHDNSPNETGFRIERCAGTGCTGFTEIATVSANVTTYQNTGLAAGTLYSYRVRAYNGGYVSGYTNTASAQTQGVSSRQITIINNMPTSLSIHDVVRLKIASDVNGFGDADLLSDDRYTTCQSLPANYIAPSHAMTFPEAIGANYSVWISIGRWETDAFDCPVSAPWIRTTSFTDPQWNLHYVYAIVNITGHVSGNLDFAVSGSYLNGILVVTVSQAGTPIGTIPFVVQ